MSAEMIFRGYDQASLDDQYNNRKRFPEFSNHFKQWSDWSQETRRMLPCKTDVAFGKGEHERLDIFPAEGGGGTPIYLMIHGGYWYSLDKSDYSFIAEGMRPHGVTTVVSNYGLAPTFNMDEIVDQNRAVIAWIWKNASSFGADANQIYICGHSAGAHLAAMLIATDWPTYDPAIPVVPLKGACLIGGIFDLEPIRRSFLNEKLNLTSAQVRRNSPLDQRYEVGVPIMLVVAADEAPEFHRQSREMHDYWRSLGFQSELHVPDGLNHYNVANQLISPESDLVNMQLRHMPWPSGPRTMTAS